MYSIYFIILYSAVYAYRPFEKMNAAEKELLRLLQRKLSKEKKSLAQKVSLQQARYSISVLMVHTFMSNVVYSFKLLKNIIRHSFTLTTVFV